ncbi:hypothetical protein [Sphingopyxis sp. MWB1]|uniref:hypothetical protein n=1 Tax=Sphingopyxis sp. MWB1 TaxID=1537715 RepID=UPI00051A0930|nr:hypothetical protein [Sphingopyxis sp. MWB1]
MNRFYLPFVAIGAALVATPTLAVNPAQSSSVAVDASVDRTTAEERANTARLNAEQAARAKTDNIVYEQEVSAATQQVAHDEAEFVDETAAYEAEKARIAAEAAAERLQWEADVAACKAGDRNRCAKVEVRPAGVPQNDQ